MSFHNPTCRCPAGHSSSQNLAKFASSSETVLLADHNTSSDLSASSMTCPQPSNKLKAVTATLIAVLIIVGCIFLLVGREGNRKHHKHHHHHHHEEGEDFRNPTKSSPLRPSRKITGGVPSRPAEFPYQVSLQAFNYDTGNYDPICGGAILDAWTILTAAHCVKEQGDFRIVAGEIVLSAAEVSGSAQIVSVYFYSHHPEWDSFQKINDIGLLFLRNPLVFNEHVFPIKLPQSNHYQIPHEEVTVVGWGSLGEGRGSADTLQKIKTKVYEKNICREQFGDDFKEQMLCAGSWDGSKDACPGDSGSPLVARDLNNEAYVAGIVSWGYDSCGIPRLLGFYTDVSYYVDWIAEEMERIGEQLKEINDNLARRKLINTHNQFQTTQRSSS